MLRNSMQMLLLRLVLFGLPLCADAIDLPKLEETKLFTTIAKDCTEVDLTKWRHKTLIVFVESGVSIEKVLLCNNRKYPIFFGKVPYDPRVGSTSRYFNPLYVRVLKANGNWPFSIVATSDNAVINVLVGTKGESLAIEEKIEPYSP